MLSRPLARRSVTALPTARQLYTSSRANNTGAAPAMVSLTVDGKAVEVAPGTTLIEACERAGVEIPRFCYHERLAIAGNCRMCLVEVEKSPKPIASCAMPVAPGMKVFTNTPNVKKAREGVMEFMLSNHPLDCPICDQAGECDLQDQSMVYGADRSRYSEIVGKRAVEDKDFGPLVRTEMTRCIHCTRCVRFANEIAGAEELGTSGRGNDMQIGMYVEKALESEMSGNIIDLCPVGALTSKPYAFTARPWELRKTESIDVMDAVGSNIRIDSRGMEVMRVMPRLNEEINEEWIADKTRFSYDGLKRQRLTTPLMREGNSFVPVTWEVALNKIRDVLSKTSGREISAVAGEMADAESLVLLRDLMHSLDSENLFFDGPALVPSAHGFDIRSNYITNSTIANIENSDAVLLIGTNPRHEAPLLQARLRKGYLNFGMEVGLVGAPVKLTTDYTHLGTSPSALDTLLKPSGGNAAFMKSFAAAKRPAIVVGADVALRPDAEHIFAVIAAICVKYNVIKSDWNGFNVLHKAAAKTAALDLGFSNADPAALADSSVLYLLDADEFPASNIPKSAFVIYQGHHGDKHAHNADIILPGAAYTEKVATYVNMEGRVQQTAAAVTPPGNARVDWTILRALSEVIGKTLPYNSPEEVYARLVQVSPTFATMGEVAPVSTAMATLGMSRLMSRATRAGLSTEPFDLSYNDYYLTNSISRASQIMAKCSAAHNSKGQQTQQKATA